MTAFCLPQGQYTSLHLDTKKEFHPFQTNTKTNTKKGSTSSIITGSLTVMGMAQRDTNQSKKKINNGELKQLQPRWRQYKKKLVFMTKTTALHLHHDFHYIFDVHYMITMWNLLMWYFMEDMKIQGRNFHKSLFEARWSP